MSGGSPPTSGQGPAGGAAGTIGGYGGFSGNSFLVPLVGGSGAGGSYNYAFENNTSGYATGYYGAGGGAGGGAILIASSTSIACNGAILAYGGASGSREVTIGTPIGYGLYGAGGSGGAVHLIAPAVSGGCNVYAYGGFAGIWGGNTGTSGFVRVESANYNGSFNFGGGPYGQVSNYMIASTPNLYLPTTVPGTIQAISVNGVNLPASPTGSFTTPDATINTPNSVGVIVRAANIPLGTVVTLQITSDQSNDMTIQCPALSGTLAASTTTCTVVFPAGFSRGYISASW
jgi:hypothetical protein